jgi:hypothetical protein
LATQPNFLIAVLYQNLTRIAFFGDYSPNCLKILVLSVVEGNDLPAFLPYLCAFSFIISLLPYLFTSFSLCLGAFVAAAFLPLF